jgi:hypothetical protein
MRSVKFQDVLYAVARKIGFTPESGNFLSNQAIPIGEYITSGINHTYTAQDFPELCPVLRVTPINHVVSYKTLFSGVSGVVFDIQRVLDVFLLDPTTTDAPISTDYTLGETGIHVGFDHGANVWIKYMESPPKFTAIPWRADSNYQRDDTVYAPRTGQCYKSRLNNNLGHDPGSTVTHEDQQAILLSEVTQERTPDNPGIPVTPKQFLIHFDTTVTQFDIPNPPNAGDVFKVYVVDSAGTLLGDAFFTTDGLNTLADVITNVVSQLTTDLGGGWTITGNTSAFTVSISNDSEFFIRYAAYETFAQPEFLEAALPVEQVANYIPNIFASAGTPQRIQVSLPAGQLIAGATYRLTFNDIDGKQYIVEQTASSTDTQIQVLQGLIDQIQGSNEPFFKAIGSSMDSISSTASFDSRNAIGIDATLNIPSSPWWQIVPFPEVLFNPVVRWAVAEYYGEQGQTDKQTTEEGKLPQEIKSVSGDFETTPTAEFTTQQKPYSRYKIQ